MQSVLQGVVGAKATVGEPITTGELARFIQEYNARDAASPVVGKEVLDSQTGVWMAPATAVAEKAPEPAVKPLPWPVEAEVVVEGVCPNPRLLEVRLVEQGTDRKGRRCSMWKGPRNWSPGNIVRVRLDRQAGKDAVYLPV